MPAINDGRRERDGRRLARRNYGERLKFEDRPISNNDRTCPSGLDCVARASYRGQMSKVKTNSRDVKPAACSLRR